MMYFDTLTRCIVCKIRIEMVYILGFVCVGMLHFHGSEAMREKSDFQGPRATNESHRTPFIFSSKPAAGEKCKHY